MKRGRFFAAAMPIWAILYVMGILAFHNHTFNVVGGLVFALIALVGSAIYRSSAGFARVRDDRFARRAARRGRRF